MLLVFGAPCQLRSLAGQEHGRTIPLAVIGAVIAQRRLVSHKLVSSGLSGGAVCMAEERLERRLAAILSADIVGYSRLMGMDEAGTLSRLNALRRELIDPMIAAHSGRIVKLMGDGALVEFASVVDAVTCAIANPETGSGARRRRLRSELRSSFGSGSTSVTSSSKAKISMATASISRRGSKASPSPEASRFPRTLAGRCKARWRPIRRYRRAEPEEYCASRARLSVARLKAASAPAAPGRCSRCPTSHRSRCCRSRT